MEQLPGGVIRLKMPMPGPLIYTNCYVLHGGAETILVDTGWYTPSALQDLESQLEEAGLSLNRLTGVILTHAHPDHYGLAAVLQQQFGLAVRFHPEEEGSLKGRLRNQSSGLSGFTLWLTQHGVPAEEAGEMASLFYRPVPGELPEATAYLQEGEMVQVGEAAWRVIWTPGHAPGHLCLWNEAEGIVITGDHLLPEETPNISLYPGSREDPLGDFLTGLKRIAALPVRLALPGHGDPFTAVGQAIETTCHHHAVRLEDVRSALREGESSAFAVACHLPWIGRQFRFRQLQGYHRWLAFGETLSHLARLAAAGEVEPVTLPGGALRYRLVRPS